MAFLAVMLLLLPWKSQFARLVFQEEGKSFSCLNGSMYRNLITEAASVNRADNPAYLVVNIQQEKFFAESIEHHRILHETPGEKIWVFLLHLNFTHFISWYSSHVWNTLKSEAWSLIYYCCCDIEGISVPFLQRRFCYFLSSVVTTFFWDPCKMCASLWLLHRQLTLWVAVRGREKARASILHERERERKRFQRRPNSVALK